jgi:hypothetical protein
MKYLFIVFTLLIIAEPVIAIESVQANKNSVFDNLFSSGKEISYFISEGECSTSQTFYKEGKGTKTGKLLELTLQGHSFVGVFPMYNRFFSGIGGVAEFDAAFIKGKYNGVMFAGLVGVEMRLFFIGRMQMLIGPGYNYPAMIYAFKDNGVNAEEKTDKHWGLQGGFRLGADIPISRNYSINIYFLHKGFGPNYSRNNETSRYSGEFNGFTFGMTYVYDNDPADVK